MFVPGLILVALNLFDIIATKLLLRDGAYETNPIIGILLGSVPAMAALAIKAAWPATLSAALYTLRSRGSKLALPGLIACCYAYAALALWHVVLFLTLKSS